MRSRRVAVVVVLVVVVGLLLVAGLVGRRLARERRVSSPPPAVAANPARSVPPPTPAAMPDRARRAVPESDPASGTIDGRVINGMTHEGVADAELTFLGDGGVSTFRTARAGNFVLTPAATGRFALVSIVAAGYLPYASPVGFSSAPLTLARGRRVHGVTLLLYPAVDYEGLVVDARGAPVPEVRVRLLGPPGEPELAQGLAAPAEWKTGRDGRFTFQAANGAVLEASRGATRGWAEVDRTVAIMKKLTIHLGHAPPHDATISGRVRDGSGAPVGDAQVRATPSAYFPPAANAVAVTAADGRFTLLGIDRVAYDLSVTAAAHLELTQAGVPGGSRDLELVLDAGLPLAGHVVDPQGSPVPSYTLVVQRRVGAARASVERMSVIDPQGRFEVRVASGDYDVIAAPPGQDGVAVQAAAGNTDLRIATGGAAVLHGQVVAGDDGTPVAGAFVGVEAAAGAKPRRLIPQTTTDRDGRFALVGLAPGPIGISVYARGYGRQVEDLPAGEPGARGPITITLSAGEPDDGRGAAISGIGVQVVPDGDVLRVVHVIPRSGAVDAGLVDGDLIVAVEDIPVAKLGRDGAIARLRGPAGTSVTLTLRRDGQDARRSVERRPLRS